MQQLTEEQLEDGRSQERGEGLVSTPESAVGSLYDEVAAVLIEVMRDGGARVEISPSGLVRVDGYVPTFAMAHAAVAKARGQ